MKMYLLQSYLMIIPGTFALRLFGQVTPPVGLHEAKGLIDHAAAQNDRWLFIMVLVLLVGGLILDKFNQVKVNRGMFDELRADRKESDKVIDRNTEALIRVEDALERQK